MISKKLDFGLHKVEKKLDIMKHKEIGYNYRMSNVVAGIGRGQLKVFKW